MKVIVCELGYKNDYEMWFCIVLKDEMPIDKVATHIYSKLDKEGLWIDNAGCLVQRTGKKNTVDEKPISDFLFHNKTWELEGWPMSVRTTVVDDCVEL